MTSVLDPDRVRPRGVKTFSKLDVHRVQRQLGTTLEGDHIAFVTRIGWGDLGPHMNVRILSPMDILEETQRVRSWGEADDAVCVGTVAFDGHLVWRNGTQGYVRLDRHPPATKAVGPTFGDAVGHLLYFAGLLDGPLPLRPY